MRFKLALCAALLLHLLPSESLLADTILNPAGDRVIQFRPAGISSKAAPHSQISEADALLIADAFLAENGAQAGLVSPFTQLKHIETRQDDLGLTHVIYHQEHQGLPILGAEVRVHINQVGEVYFASPTVVVDLPASTTPSFSGDDLRRIAEESARELLPAFAEVEASIDSPALVLRSLGLSQNGIADDTRLAWEFHVQFPRCAHGECPVLGAYVSIDARTAEVLFAVHDFKGLDRRVYDCALQPDDGSCGLDLPGINGYIHGRSEGQPARGPHNIPGMLQFGSTDVDSMYVHAGAIHSFVQTKYNLNGANNQGGTRTLVAETNESRYYVHYDYYPQVCPHSALIGPTNSIALCVGDASHEDIIGHEYGHAILKWAFTSGGVPFGPDFYDVETRALEESHSDVLGEAFEFDQTGMTDWMSGSLIGYNPPWRNLANPNDLIGDWGARYAARFYDQWFNCDTSINTAGFYQNSTVYSHAFYLAAEGNQFNGCEIQGQGMEFAHQVYHRAWKTYFSSSQNFNTADDRILQACNDLYSPTACGELAKALQAVEADQVGICDDPLGALGESAPPCAESHGGDLETVRSDTSPDSTFQVSESVWASLANGTPGRTVDFALLPHNPARPIWDDLAGQALEQSSGTLDSTGALFVYFFTPSVEDTFDVIVDGNRDGYYQPWADETATIVVSGVATDVEAGTVPTARLLQSVRPNPFNPTTTFSLRLAETTRLRLTVFTSVGRQVRTLVEENALPPGSYSYEWDGRDNSGNPVASGIYLYRIESMRGNELGKVTLVR